MDSVFLYVQPHIFTRLGKLNKSYFDLWGKVRRSMQKDQSKQFEFNQVRQVERH